MTSHITGLVVVIAASLNGCTVAPGEKAVDSTAVASKAQESPAPTGPETTEPPSADAAPHDAEVPAAPDALTEATSLGTSALGAFCRPALEYDTWIGELYPFLSQAAGAAYETVDPANVPCTTVAGVAVVRDGDDPYTVGIVIPTDAGDYEVYLHRTGEDSPWAVEQITPVSAG